MNPETILPCPNPECRSACEVHRNYFMADGKTMATFDSEVAFTVHKVWCTNYAVCGYRGPNAPTESEAVELHNFLCQPMQALTTVSIPSRPPADWSAAARDIGDLLRKDEMPVSDAHEAEIAAILGHAQSQPSAPVHKEWCRSLEEDRMSEDGEREFIKPCNCGGKWNL